MQLERHGALAKQIEFIGRFVFAEQIFPGRETHIARAARDRRTKFGAEAGEEWLPEHDALKSLHRHPSVTAPAKAPGPLESPPLPR